MLHCASFTASVGRHVQVLVVGAVLALGKRIVTQALHVMGLAEQPGFGRYHAVLIRDRPLTLACGFVQVVG